MLESYQTVKDRNKRGEALCNAITKRSADETSKPDERVGDYLINLYSDTDDLHYNVCTVVALMAHFANVENIAQLPEWLQKHIGKQLHKWHSFFNGLQEERDEFTLYLDYWRAHYWGGLAEHEFRELEEKYL